MFAFCFDSSQLVLHFYDSAPSELNGARFRPRNKYQIGWRLLPCFWDEFAVLQEAVKPCEKLVISGMGNVRSVPAIKSAPLIKGEVGGSSPPLSTVHFRWVSGRCPKISTHNPIHTYLTSPHERRSDSRRGEIFSSRRQNHLTGGGLLNLPALLVLTTFHLF